MTIVASRREFSEYRANARQRHRDEEAKATGRKNRTFFTLLVQFWSLLRGYGMSVVFSLCTLTLVTLLHLIPPAATKLAVDYVLVPSAKLPAWISRWSDNRLTLLFTLASGVLAVSLLSSMVHLW